MKNNKVVYGWFADGIPFYIGIGSVKRSQSKKDRNKYCLNKRSKAERETCFEIRILYQNLTWQEACEIEISLISLYGRVDLKTGILTNMTDGGEGAKHWKGKKLTQEHKSKMSESAKGNRNGCKPVQTPAGMFESSAEASSFYGIPRTTFRGWLNNPRKPEFSRIL